MKRTVTALSLLFFISATAFSQQKATLVIIRDTGFSGSAVGISAFINNDFVGRIPNRSVTKIEVTPGMNTFNFQFYGRKKANPKRIKATINMEAGKTYYVAAINRMNFFYSTMQTVEISENSAKQLSSNLRSHSVKM